MTPFINTQKADRRVLVIGFRPSEIDALFGDDMGWIPVADPDFRLAARDEGRFCAALIGQRQTELLSHLQIRYLFRVARKIPLITFVADGHHIVGQRFDCGSNALMFSSTTGLLDEICLLADEDYWLLPGDIDGVSLLLGDSADAKANRLTVRDWYLLREIQKGKSNAEIARYANRSVPEIKSWLFEIFNSLEVTTRTQAAIVAHFIEQHSSRPSP
ncbi:helix-turn-helix transcriptional regulator [Thalassospira mesophila]|uniref:HTH luxR-type domain-containing protein n=1 Tax=Thalassospira mesophila TaxID=1293891 RepID=A0A1Y2L1J5_9PROT|nr:LuxR C-terminal-related transcriptional regulator [Thalassospira mesophila]OSQ39360.1 hypothetical protein TMES_04595 [Thalassospira mesophila]